MASAQPRSFVARAAATLLPTLVIVATIVTAYLPAMDAGLVWDDALFLFEIPVLRADDGLRRIWFSTEAPDYWPLTYSAFWAMRRIWGPQPEPYHVVNILLHAASAVVLWRTLRRLVVPGALLATLAFGVHPVAVASVAWLSELKNTLSMLLFLSTIAVYLRFDESGGRRSYTAALLLFAAALLAKSSVVMLPLVLLLLAWWRRGRIERKDVRRALPFFALSLAMGLVTIWFQQGGPTTGDPVRPEGALSRLAASGWVVWFYLWKVVAPVRLAAIYPRWDVDGSAPAAFLPLALLAAVFLVLIACRRSWGRHALVGAGYFVLMLFPVLGFFDMRYAEYSLVADHLQYPAMVGVIALVASGATAVFQRTIASPAARRALATALIASLGLLTWRQAELYRDPHAFWTHTIRLNDQAWAAYGWRAAVSMDDGRVEEAVDDYTRMVQLEPEDPTAYYYRAVAHVELGQLKRALRDLTRAVELNPDEVRTYYERGKVHLRRGDPGLAVDDFDRVIAREPDHAHAYDARGVCHEKLGQLDDALRDFGEAIRLAPRATNALRHRARLHLRLGRTSEAWADAKSAARLGKALPPDLLEALRQATGDAQSRQDS